MTTLSAPSQLKPLPETPCRECGSTLTTDPRFVQWCQSCGWNAHPDATVAKTRGDRFDRRLNRAAEERLYRRLTVTTGPRPTRGAAWFGAYALAGLVHLINLAVASAE